LARKRHRCHRNEKQARFVGNRRAFRAFLVDFNFPRFAPTIHALFSPFVYRCFVCGGGGGGFFCVEWLTVTKLSQI
jgi:hypothetical protein